MQPTTLSHLSSAAERARRYETLRAAMGEAGLDALVIAGRGNEFLRGRLQYASDIFQWAGYGYVVLPASGDAAYVGDPLWGLGRATAAGWIDDLRLSLTPGSEAVAALGGPRRLLGPRRPRRRQRRGRAPARARPRGRVRRRGRRGDRTCSTTSGRSRARRRSRSCATRRRSSGASSSVSGPSPAPACRSATRSPRRTAWHGSSAASRASR